MEYGTIMPQGDGRSWERGISDVPGKEGDAVGIGAQPVCDGLQRRRCKVEDRDVSVTLPQ